MTAAIAPLARQVATRAQKDKRFAEVLDALLTAPTTPHGTLERIAARKLNDQRRAALVEDFVDGSMRTPEVQTLLKLRTPQAVHRLRSRGKMGVGSLRAGSKDRSRPACMLHVNRQRCPP
jgi:hypothetical protein